MRSLISLFSLTRHLSASFPGQSGTIQGSCAVRILSYTPLDSLTSPTSRQLLERCFWGAAAKLTSTGWLSTSLSRLRQCRRTRYVGILKPGNRQAITGLLQATIGSTPNCSQVDPGIFHLSASLRCRDALHSEPSDSIAKLHQLGSVVRFRLRERVEAATRQRSNGATRKGEKSYFQIAVINSVSR